VRALYHALDYNQVSSAAEIVDHYDEAMSRFLYTMDGIGHLVDQRVLMLADVDVVSSQILRVLIDSQVVQGYLQWLDTEYTKMGRPTPSHWRARRLAEQLVAYQKKRYRRPQVRRP